MDLFVYLLISNSRVGPGGSGKTQVRRYLFIINNHRVRLTPEVVDTLTGECQKRLDARDAPT